MGKRQGKSIKRRTVVAAIGASAGMLALGGTANASKPAWKGSPPTKPVGDLTQHRPVPTPTPDVTALFGDLAAGARLGKYKVAAIYPVRMGAIAVVLEHRGATFQLDVLKRDDKGPSPVGQTPSLAVFVSNQGDGKRPTDEIQGLGALALAAALAEREAAGAKAPALLSLRERSKKFPQGFYGLS
jgi:hypothetical protein